MNFLNSTILLLSALALIPILIHLFNRQRVKRIQFSSIRYLKSLQKTRMRRIKLKQILLLILRTLIILMLVIAFARPTGQGSYSAALGSAAQASIIVMIDNSLSMSAEARENSLLNMAKQDARRLLDNFSARDEIALISFNQQPQVQTNGFTTNHTFVGDAIEALEATRMATNPQAAFKKALELLQGSRNLVKEIYVFSDMAGNAWETLTAENPSETATIRIYAERLTIDDYENVKPVNLDFGNSLIYPGRPVNISADVVNESGRRIDNLLVSLYVNRVRISQADLSLSAHSSEKVGFLCTFERSGEHEGYLELTDDDLIEDNRLYFTVNIPSQIEILSLYENENDDYFIRMAYKPLPESPSQVSLTSQPISRLTSLDLYDYDCVLLSSTRILSQANLSKLESYVKSGGSLLAFVGDDANRLDLNNRLFKPVFGSELLGSLVVTPGEGFFRISSLDFTHPILSRLGEIDKAYKAEMDFYKILKIGTPSKGRVLAGFSNGSPAIIEAVWGKGRVLAILSSASLQDSELVNHPFFLTFINRAAEYMAYDLNRLREKYFTGETIARVLTNVNPRNSVEVVTPSGEKIYPAYNFTGSELNLTIPQIKTNGISRILIDGSELEIFAVNIPADESNGRFLDLKDFKKAFSGTTVIELNSGSDYGQIIRESRHGRELSKIFFLLALAFLAMEMFLARGSAEPSQNAA